MSSSFSSIAVIGAGTMGAGIAAQIANAGHKVLLLDLPAGDKGGKTPAEMAVDKLLVSEPPQLMHKSVASLIRTGTIEDDADALGTCDWIVEAVIERLDVKKQLYQKLHQIIRADCIVTSNTSTIPISLLVEDMPETFRQRFAITHYVNPVRFMRGLERVRGQDPDEAVMDRPSGLSKSEKEMIVIASSAENNCLYCVIAHGAILRIYENEPLIADQIATNYKKADITPRQEAMLDFAIMLCHHSDKIDEDDFEILRAHGFSDEDIWDIGAIVALFGLSNRMANLISMRPNDEFFSMGRTKRQK